MRVRLLWTGHQKSRHNYPTSDPEEAKENQSFTNEWVSKTLPPHKIIVSFDEKYMDKRIRITGTK